jgi:hypothetical protein
MCSVVKGFDLVPDSFARMVRYRCGSCGNLTRFDVTTVRRSRGFHHYTVGGELSIEDEQVLEERVEEVRCRWCDSPDQVSALD